jgi:hypothetical protein
MAKEIKYNYYFWGPFLYQTKLDKKEISKVKKLCSKKSKDVRTSLAGLIKNEHEIDVNKLYPIIEPYIQSYSEGFRSYRNKSLGDNVALIRAWVNYMTKFETNPLHVHGEDLSFVIILSVPKQLIKEREQTISRGNKQGELVFISSLSARDEFITSHNFFPEVGDFFIFPAALHHYVNSFKSDGERISVSGNLRIING